MATEPRLITAGNEANVIVEPEPGAALSRAVVGSVVGVSSGTLVSTGTRPFVGNILPPTPAFFAADGETKGLKTEWELAVEACDKTFSEDLKKAGDEYQKAMDKEYKTRGQEGQDTAGKSNAEQAKKEYKEAMQRAKADHKVNRELVDDVFKDSKPKGK